MNDIENKKRVRDEVVRDWPELVASLREILDTALDVAGRLASFEEEWNAIENVREFVYDWMSGSACRVQVTDLSIALSSIFGTIEVETGIDTSAVRAPLRALLDNPARLPVWIRCPGADSDEKPTAVIRRFPGQRNCAASVTACAA